MCVMRIKDIIYAAVAAAYNLHVHTYTHKHTEADILYF